MTAVALSSNSFSLSSFGGSSFGGSFFRAPFARRRGARGAGGATGSSGNLSGVKDGELRNRASLVVSFFQNQPQQKFSIRASHSKICHTIF